MAKIRHSINPPDLFNSVQFGFSQIMVSQGQTTIYLSGQVGWDENGAIIGPGDLGIQARASMENVKRALAHANATLEDIVAMRIYFVEDVRDQNREITATLKENFPENPPVTTWLGVTSLANLDFLIEIEAVAVI